MSRERFERALLELPRARSFFDSLVEDLLAGRHLLLLTGGHVSIELAQLGLRDALLRKAGGAQLRVVDALARSAATPPSEWLAQELGIDQGSLVPGGHEPGHVVGIWDVVSLTGVGQEESAPWLDYFASAAKYGIGRETMLVLPAFRAPARLATLVPDARFSVRTWWGVLSQLDTRSMCRDLEDERQQVRAAWREALVAGLSYGSPTVAERIWDAVFEREDALLSALAESARSEGLNPERIRQLSQNLLAAGRANPDEQGPPIAWRALWDEGAVQATVEHGPELTAAAAALIGDEATVRSRIWRAQASLLFPWLSELRQRVCRVMVERYGKGWALDRDNRLFDDEQREWLRKDPLAVDFGALEELLRNSGSLGARYGGVAVRARKMRNRVAHHQPVSWADFKGLADAAKTLGLIE